MKMNEFLITSSNVIEGKLILRREQPQLIGWNGRSLGDVDNLISMYTHRRILNSYETKCVLQYLVAVKYNLLADDGTNQTLVDNGIIMIELTLMIRQYINSRDYKMLQYIYDDSAFADYAYSFYKFFSMSKTPHIAWRLSLTSWDVEFTKFIYKNVIAKVPDDMAGDIKIAFLPDLKFMSKLRLMDVNSNKFKYYDKKITMLQNMFKSNESKTH